MQYSVGTWVLASMVAVALGGNLRADSAAMLVAAPGAAPAAAPAAPPAAALTASPAKAKGAGRFDHDQYADDWGNEWQSGNFPSYKKTQKKTYFRSADYEDSQSDGKPSAGLTGDKVGAYLPMPLPQGHGVF